MSRTWLVLFAIAASSPAPAIAQQAGSAASAGTQAPASGSGSPTGNGVSDADRAVAERMMSAGGRVTPESARTRCLRTQRAGEIVVCAPEQDQFRIPSTSETDPLSDQALDDGRLTPPDVAGNGIFKGKATVGGMCLVPPCPPEQPYMIDLKSIPEAPAGSEADQVARGELRAH